MRKQQAQIKNCRMFQQIVRTKEILTRETTLFWQKESINVGSESAGIK